MFIVKVLTQNIAYTLDREFFYLSNEKVEIGVRVEITFNRRTLYGFVLSIEETEKVDKNFNNIMFLVEAYPDLKANTQFLDLQNTLKEIENKLSYARSNYNNVVTSYNNLVESVPSNIIAKIFIFSKKKLFEIEDKEKENNKLDF